MFAKEVNVSMIAKAISPQSGVCAAILCANIGQCLAFGDLDNDFVNIDPI